MSLLIDENLSDRLPRSLQDIFPDSFHVRGVGLESTDDDEIWAYARTQGLAIVTKDKDYFQLSLERGHPPKVVLIRTGNTPTIPLRESRHSFAAISLKSVVSYRMKKRH